MECDFEHEGVVVDYLDTGRGLGKAARKSRSRTRSDIVRDRIELLGTSRLGIFGAKSGQLPKMIAFFET